MEKIEIETKVTEILQKNPYAIKDTFVDVLKLAQGLDFVVGNAKLQQNEDGFIIVDPSRNELFGYKTQKVIGVNSSRDFPTKRFIIAHELGHFVFNAKEGKLFANREHKNIKGRSEKENKIDYFAACLLMPKDLFVNKVKELKESGYKDNKLIEILSDMFIVPVESARRRIEEVGEVL